MSHNNNPQQYCVSHTVKLMSMFPFIECYITVSGCSESSISDCHRSIWLCTTEHPRAVRERPWCLFRLSRSENNTLGAWWLLEWRRLVWDMKLSKCQTKCKTEKQWPCCYSFMCEELFQPINHTGLSSNLAVFLPVWCAKTLLLNLRKRRRRILSVYRNDRNHRNWHLE